ncbi:hypothetical protein [Paracidovorax konjaci]|uniref:Uncharacterized protein n=1 Tax=Paracidovorax konjaci TaxID=32040 RepID=A0A1I1TVD3_9BURK|nr:hypothetical protein [Paracidovorax konjaci]SFD62489.1 hypothetical protein SAMN04489710_10482 [Paracidovorax konjaci]
MINPFLAAGMVLCAAVPVSVGAQNTPPSTLPASQAKAATPDSYRSAFEGYRPYTEESVGDWKAINATTAKIGGWRVYAKEAREPHIPNANVDPGKGIAPAEPAKP